MMHIVFQYRDRFTGDRWSEQECITDSVEECKRIYGLGVDCEYRIIKSEVIG